MGKYNLVCIAHPDDETIFFGGLLQTRPGSWQVICVTSDGNPARRRQFLRACRLLKVTKAHWWQYPDRYDKRLPIDPLVQRLRELPVPQRVYTHSIIGDYGHPHHQDVSRAVHEAFDRLRPVHAVAYNCRPDQIIALTEAQYRLKCRILTEVYGSETNRFLNVLPATWCEGFARLDLREVRAIYQFLAGERPLASRSLRHYRWLRDYLPLLRDLRRPF